MKIEDLPEPIQAPVKEAIIQGRKIEAIKLYRETTNSDLKDAKEAIESITEELLKSNPELKIQKASGCASVIILTFVLGSALSLAIRFA